ncbi:MAG: tetratricopeptide repeat protein [Paracoccaceae bacterium]
MAQFPFTARRVALSMLTAAAVLVPAGTTAQGVAGPYLAAEQAARRGDLLAASEYYTAALARDPDNAAMTERAISHLIAAGRLSQSIGLARRLQQLEPGRHVAVMAVAVDELRRGEADEAGLVLELATNGDTPLVGRIVQAWALFGQDDPDAAISALEALAEEGLGGPAGASIAAYHRGLIEAAIGDDLDAVAAFEVSAEQSSLGSQRFVRHRSGALARVGRTDEAIALIDARLDRTLGAARLERLRDDLAAGAMPEPLVRDAAAGAAEALYDFARYLMSGPNSLLGLSYARLAVHLAPDIVDAHLLIAEQLRRQEQPELAIAAYDLVPSDVPESLEARIGRAEALEDADRLVDAIDALDAVIASFPDSLDAHSALGTMLRQNERFAEAAEAYDRAVALIDEAENRHWPLFYQRGISYERSKQWPKAEADFKTALELEPDQPLVLNYLGYSWVEMGTNLDEAKAMIEKAVEQRPDDGYIVDSLGWVLYRLGDFEGAVKHLGRAVELRPVDPVINDHYGDALWMVGRRIEAEFQWHRALSFEPEPEDEARILRKLDIGLDTVLEEEAAAGNPAIIGQTGAPSEPRDGG